MLVQQFSNEMQLNQGNMQCILSLESANHKNFIFQKQNDTNDSITSSESHRQMGSFES